MRNVNFCMNRVVQYNERSTERTQYRLTCENEARDMKLESKPQVSRNSDGKIKQKSVDRVMQRARLTFFQGLLGHPLGL